MSESRKPAPAADKPTKPYYHCCQRPPSAMVARPSAPGWHPGSLTAPKPAPPASPTLPPRPTPSKPASKLASLPPTHCLPPHATTKNTTPFHHHRESPEEAPRKAPPSRAALNSPRPQEPKRKARRAASEAMERREGPAQCLHPNKKSHRHPAKLLDGLERWATTAPLTTATAPTFARCRHYGKPDFPTNLPRSTRSRRAAHQFSNKKET